VRVSFGVRTLPPFCRHANEVRVRTVPSRVSYVFEKQSELGGKQHEVAYVDTFIQVVASIQALLDGEVAVGFKGESLKASDCQQVMEEFARAVYWDEEDCVRLPLAGADLDLLCNADPIAFVLLTRGERFP